MATETVPETHPIALGLGEWYRGMVNALVIASNVYAIPMFWHIGCNYKEQGWEEYKKNSDAFFATQIIRTVIPGAIALLAYVAGDQRWFAIGGGFTVGALLDVAISHALATGLSKKHT